jgi:hypothetical protein
MVLRLIEFGTVEAAVRAVVELFGFGVLVLQSAPLALRTALLILQSDLRFPYQNLLAGVRLESGLCKGGPTLPFRS